MPMFTVQPSCLIFVFRSAFLSPSLNLMSLWVFWVRVGLAPSCRLGSCACASFWDPWLLGACSCHEDDRQAQGQARQHETFKASLISHWLTFHWSNRVTQSSPKLMEEMVYSAHNEPWQDCGKGKDELLANHTIYHRYRWLSKTTILFPKLFA